MHVVAVVAQKGGVGKTTTAMSLAAICAEASRTFVVDVDPQQSATSWAEEAAALPFDFTTEGDVRQLAGLREAVSEHFDVVFIDTPGSLEGGDMLATVVAAADYVIVPTEPAPLSVKPLIRTVHQVIAPTGVPYRVLVNKFDGRSPGMRDEAFDMLDAQGIRRFKAATRHLSIHASAPGDGLVVTQYPRGRYAIEAASEYRAVALEMFADWHVSVGRHSRLAVAARTEAAPA